MRYPVLNFINYLKRSTLFSNFVNLSSIQISNALLQILFFPLIIRIVGIQEFGYVILFNSYAALAGMVINYGTNQSGLKEIVYSKNNPYQLSKSFFSILSVRLLLFLIYILLNGLLLIIGVPHVTYFTLAGTIVLAEAINPLVLFLGTEKLFLYNLLNATAKFATILLVLFFVNNSEQGPWVNFFIGLANCLAYLVLIVIATKKFELKFYIPSAIRVKNYLLKNFYLLFNNVSVQLQQSFFLFMVAGTGNPVVLGAYAIGDKIIWSARLLLIAISNAIFPKGALAYKTGLAVWRKYKKKLTLVVGGVFFVGSLVLLISADFIIQILTKENNPTATLYLRAMAFAPFFAALNVFNVLELLYKSNNRAVFLISVALLFTTILITLLLVKAGTTEFYGFYPIILDLFALAFYTYYNRRCVNPFVQ